MNRIKQFKKDEHGAITVIVAILLVVILGFTALVIDLGLSYHNKNKLQSAADAVTLAVSTMGADSLSYNPVKNYTENINLCTEIQKYFESNGIEDFKFDKNNTSASNIKVYSMRNKERAIQELSDNPDESAALVFYNSDTETQYIEIYAHKKTTAIFGNIVDIGAYDLTVDSAAKCEVKFGGNPESLNYQILEIDGTENFDITGPIENTGLKTFLTFVNNATNGVFKFLQEDTKFISKYIMGGKTEFTCPYCGKKGLKAEFEVTDESGNISYACPDCNKEVSITDDSTAVVTTWTTSVAVINGYIHSNGGVKINIDSIRLNRSLVETITCPTCHERGRVGEGFTKTEVPVEDGPAEYKITCDNCARNGTTTEVGTADSVWTTYWNGMKYSARPILELCKGANSLDIDTTNARNGQPNDVYLVGDEYQVTNEAGEVTNKITRTLYKSGSEAQHADFMRTSKQILYGSSDVKKCDYDNQSVSYSIDMLGTTVKKIDIDLLSAVKNSYNDISSVNDSTVVGSETKKYSGQSEKVNFNLGEADTSVTKTSNTTASPFGEMNVNGNTMLGKINLGGNKTLPDVYDVFTSYYNFDFDFDGAIDSLDCVTIGQVAAAKDAQKKDNNVAQIVANKRTTLTDTSDDNDTARVLIDKVVTDITGEKHSGWYGSNNYNVKKVYDINVPYAVSTKGRNIFTSLSQQEKSYRTNDTNIAIASTGIGDTIKNYNSIVKNTVLNRYHYGINFDEKDEYNNFAAAHPNDENSHASRRYYAVKSDYEDLTNSSSYYSPAFTVNGKKYLSEDFVVGRDGKVKVSLTDVISEYYTNFAKSFTVPGEDQYTYDSIDFDGKKSSYNQKDYMLNLENGRSFGRISNPRDNKGISGNELGFKIADGYNIMLLGGVYLSKTSKQTVVIGDNAKLYIKDSAKDSNGAFCNSAASTTIGNNSIMYVEGAFNQSGGDLNIGSNSILYVTGNLTVNKGKKINMGPGSKLVVKGNIDASAISASETSDIYAASIHNGNESGTSVGNIYCFGNYTAYGFTARNCAADTPGVFLIGGNYVSQKDTSGIDFGKNVNAVILGDILGCGIINVYDGATVYVGGSFGTTDKWGGILHIYDNTKINVDKDVTLSGFIDGAKAAKWAMSVKGNVVVNASGNDTGSGVGKNSSLTILGSYNGAGDDFCNNGSVYCRSGFKAKNLTNNGVMGGLNNFTSAEKTTNNGVIYSQYSLVDATNDVVNSQTGYIVCATINSYSGDFVNYGCAYARENINCKGYACSTASTSAWTYVGKTLNISGSSASADTYGLTYVNGCVTGNGRLNIRGGYFCVNGVAVDENGSTVSDIALADHTNGINASTINLYSNAKVFVNGRVVLSADLSYCEDGKAQMFVNSSGDSGNALTVGTSLTIYSGNKLYVSGNAQIGYSSDGSIINKSNGSSLGAYIYVSNTLTTTSKISALQMTIIHCGNLVCKGSMKIGDTNFSKNVVPKTGLIVDGNLTCDGALENYASIYVGANVVANNDLSIDDNSEFYVGANLVAGQLVFFDNGGLYVNGNTVDYRNSNSNKPTFDSNNSYNTFLCTGSITFNGTVTLNNTAKVLSGNDIISNDGIYIGPNAMMYARRNIEFKASSITVDNILYADSIDGYSDDAIWASCIITNNSGYGIVSNNSSISTLTYMVRSNVYPTPPIYTSTIRNHVRYYGKNGANTNTVYSYDINATGNYTIGVADKDVTVKNGVTIRVTGGDLYINGYVTSYGNIVCLADENGNGGNIYVQGNSDYASLRNCGTLYCDKNLEVQGTDYVLSAVGVGALHAGRSLTNGTNSDGRAELYVGGHIKTYASFDNFGQAYIGDYIEAGTKYDCVTYASGQNSTGPSVGNVTGVAVDSENNSVLLVGGYIYASDASAKTSVLVRKNAVLYSGQSVRTTRNFIVGNAFFKDGKTSENGAQQFEYLKSYNGLNTSLDAYVISDISDKAALQVVADSSETVYQNQIKYSDVKGKVYDQYGEKYNVSVGDYVVFKKSIDGHSSSTAYDFGFAYINGTLTTGTGSANYFQPYGKSVVYVGANKTSMDRCYNVNCALDTHHIFTFPYSRVFINGAVKTYGGNSDGIAFNEWFYSIFACNGSIDFRGTVKMRDGTKTFINGDLTTNKYLEIGKAYDGKDEAYDPVNPTFVQCSGDVRVNGTYLKLFARSTLNSGGSIVSTTYITLRHHANIRALGDVSGSQLDIGSGSTACAGGSMKSRLSNIKIRDDCTVYVGGNNGGNLQALSYIEIGKHENEDYKYNNCATNRKKDKDLVDKNNEIDIDDGNTGGSGEDKTPENDPTNDEIERITCPNCGKEGSLAGGQFTKSDNNGVPVYTCVSCNYQFGDNSDAFEGDDAIGSTVYVNGTIKSTLSYLKLFGYTNAYANKSIRSLKYITLRHHSGLYVLTGSPDSTGIAYEYDNSGRLLDANGNVVPNFYVDTNSRSQEYGSIYYYGSFDGADRKIYGFTVKVDDSESFDADKSKGYIYNGMLYYYDSKGDKVTCEVIKYADADFTVIEAEHYYYVNSSYQLVEGGEDIPSSKVSDTAISLVVTAGSVTSYGDLSVNSYASLYATGNVSSFGKYYAGPKSVTYAEGDFICTKLLDLSSLLTKDNLDASGFQLSHGALHAGGRVRVYSCSTIEGGTIDAVGDVLFDSIYTKYVYKYTDPTKTPFTDPTAVDLWICSENGNVTFNCIYCVTGGVTYAPNGKIKINGIYFEHYGCFIGGDNNINAFYINIHRLANADTLDMKWPYAGKVYLCKAESYQP